MKPPKCRLCGKEHYGLCVNPGSASAARHAPVVSGEGGSHRPSGATPPAAGSGRSDSGPPLTPAVVPKVSLITQSLTEMAGDVLRDIAASTTYSLTTDEIREKIKRGEITLTLTPAQKQKAYRERNKDRVREANKLRMRKKRRD